MQTISPRRLFELHQQSPIELIDVRTPREFEDTHASMARNVPLDRLDPNAILSTRADKASTLYVICRSGSRAGQACERFIAAGFENVVNVEGGTTAWVNDGLPVMRGRKSMSLDRQMRIVAGSLVLIGVALAYFIDPRFIGLSAFVGAGLTFAGITDLCPMMNALAMMPWNQSKSCNV